MTMQTYADLITAALRNPRAALCERPTLPTRAETCAKCAQPATVYALDGTPLCSGCGVAHYCGDYIEQLWASVKEDLITWDELRALTADYLREQAPIPIVGKGDADAPIHR